MPLLRSQKNTLLVAIRDKGMNPGDFTPTTDGSDGTMIAHGSSKYHFAIDAHRETHNIGTFSCVYSPGENATYGVRSGITWSYLLRLFESWLSYLEREITQPDLWEALATSRIPDTLPDDNSPFTEPEQHVIKERLGQIRDYAYRVLPELTEQPEWGRRLEAKLDYLAESSNRMGRKDWFTLFAGVILPFALSGAMDSDAAKDFLEFTWQVMYQVFPSLSY